MVYEGVYNSTGDHNNASILGGDSGDVHATMTNIDLHHNLFASTITRLPNISAGSGSFVNNLVFNWSWYATGFYKGVTWDLIGNRYKRGTMTPTLPNPTGFPISLWIYDLSASTPAPSLYLRGNVGADGTMPADQWSLTTMKQVESNVCVDQNGARTSGCQAVYSGWRRGSERAKPSTYVPITATSALDAEAALIGAGGVGASRRLGCDGSWINYRDAQDARLIGEYVNGGGIAGTYVSEDSVGGFPALPAGTPCADGDQDGIPDEFESARCGTATCLDPNAVQASGFTNLEVYLAGR
jgi:hypothetical protein